MGLNKKISIALLANTFIDRSATGTGRVAQKLFEILAVKFSQSVEIKLICDSNSNFTVINQLRQLYQFEIIKLPKVRFKTFRSAREYFSARHIISSKIDIVHFMLPRQYPFFYKFPARHFVSTFHAGGDVTAPVDKFVLSRHVYNWVGKTQNHRLSKIVAVSHLAKKEIASAYKISPTKIDVIPIGTDHLWNLQEIANQEIKKYILIVGRWQKYKNLEIVLSSIKNNKAFFTKSYKLIILSGQNSKLQKITYAEDFFASFSNKEAINLENVTELDLKRLYKHASLVIYPSINEGFGLPAFEAFGEGAPILIHTETPAAQYLKGKDGVTVSDLTSNTDNIFAAIKTALVKKNTNSEDNRRYLKNLGLTWDEMARSYSTLYQKIINGNH